MPVPTSAASWTGSLLWLVGLAVAAFAVSWVVANRLRVPRTPYIGVLTVLTASLTVGYVWWVGVDGWAFLTTNWMWGVLAAPLAAGFPAIGMTKLPAVQHLSGRRLAVALLWEGVVYGVAEGVLLSVLPAFMTWQMVHSLGWSGAGGAIARWGLPVVASVVVIVVHHLGYWEYRNRLLVPISLGCGLLTVGYLVTASPIAAALGHVLTHASALRHGAELPPHPHAAPAANLTERPSVAGSGASRGGAS